MLAFLANFSQPKVSYWHGATAAISQVLSSRPWWLEIARIRKLEGTFSLTHSFSAFDNRTSSYICRKCI